MDRAKRKQMILDEIAEERLREVEAKEQAERERQEAEKARVDRLKEVEKEMEKILPELMDHDRRVVPKLLEWFEEVQRLDGEYDALMKEKTELESKWELAVHEFLKLGGDRNDLVKLISRAQHEIECVELPDSERFRGFLRISDMLKERGSPILRFIDRRLAMRREKWL